MPADLRIRMIAALEEVAALSELATHPDVRRMKGDKKDWHRLRLGSYRAIMKVVVKQVGEVLYVDYIGPRGDAY